MNRNAVTIYPVLCLYTCIDCEPMWTLYTLNKYRNVYKSLYPIAYAMISPNIQ